VNRVEDFCTGCGPHSLTKCAVSCFQEGHLATAVAHALLWPCARTAASSSSHCASAPAHAALPLCSRSSGAEPLARLTFPLPPARSALPLACSVSQCNVAMAGRELLLAAAPRSTVTNSASGPALPRTHSLRPPRPELPCRSCCSAAAAVQSPTARMAGPPPAALGRAAPPTLLPWVLAGRHAP